MQFANNYNFPHSPLLAAQAGSGFAIHPLLVHFPIALLLVGSVALLWQLVLQWRDNRTLSNSLDETNLFIKNLDIFAIGALSLGYAGLVITIGAGLADLLGSPKGQVRDGWIPIAIIHLSAGFGLMLLYGILLFRRFLGFGYDPTTTASTIAPHFDWLTLAIVVSGIILLIVTGWFGGELVYSYRVGIS